ncbi:MAG: ABC transporter ATP-binding protein [Candidatus Izemoplasmatales bacterium]
MNLLELKDVWKLYGEKTALSEVTLSIEEGEIVGLLGLNGAGKSTLMKIVAGLAPLSRGSARVGGFDVEQEHGRAARLVGAMIETPAFHQELTGWQNMILTGLVIPDVSKKDMLAAIETVGLEDQFGFAVKKYSVGMKQRLHFARAILGHPRLLLLDEPLSGIDPIAAKRIRDAIIAFAASGGAAVVSSHVLAEIEHFCTRIVIIDRGQIVLDRPRAEVENLEALFLDVVTGGGKAQ